MVLGISMKEGGKLTVRRYDFSLGWETITQDPRRSDGAVLCLAKTDRAGKSDQR